MSVTAATIHSAHLTSASPQGKQTLGSSAIDYVASKKRKEDNSFQSSVSNSNNNNNNNKLNGSTDSMEPKMTSSQGSMNKDNGNVNSSGSLHQSSTTVTDTTTTSTTSSDVPTSSTLTMNGSSDYNSNHTNSGQMNGSSPNDNSAQSQYVQGATMNGLNGTTNYSQQNSNIDPAAPLPNEIFDLLNDFWRPNELVAPDTHLLNGKFSRRSPDGSLDETTEEDKEGDDDITSLADNDMSTDRTTQKRRYSRLSDGYERLKSVLPTVKDKRRVSKARILDEAINYIQRLESITSVLKREHEKRLSMLNSSNGFFPDYSVQPYMGALFQKQSYPGSTGGGMPSSKMSSYGGKNSQNSKSPRVKQYNQSYNSATHQNSMGVSPSNMGVVGGGSADYNYNNISSSYNASSLYQSNSEQMMNAEGSPISNSSPYSACSLSPGSTPATYQNGSAAVNSTWPYQGSMTHGYDSGQLSSYQSRQVSAGSGYGSSNPYSAMNGNMWGSMGNGDAASQVVQPTADHSMKVG